MIVFSRLIRQLFIVVIFLAVLSLGWWFFQRTNTPTPTCIDSIQNGQEEGVDCGVLACEIECPLELGSPQVISKKLIPARSQDYDFVAEIRNPHSDFGASEVAYELILLNDDGKELLRKNGIFYILPNQTKFLILPFLTTEKNVSNISFNVKSAVWQKFDSVDGVKLTPLREKYSILQGKSSSVLEAMIVNDSDFDFDTVDIDIILRNSKGEIIAVNKSKMNTLLAHTERGFEVVWPFPVKEKVEKIEIKASTNLFENSNFIKRYGSGPEQFQRY